MDALRLDGVGPGSYVNEGAPVSFSGALFVPAMLAIPDSVAEELARVPGGETEISVFADIAVDDDLASTPRELTVWGPSFLGVINHLSKKG